MITEYVIPPQSPVAVTAVCADGLHKKEYGETPPNGDAVTDPLQTPLQVAGV